MGVGLLHKNLINKGLCCLKYKAGTSALRGSCLHPFTVVVEHPLSAKFPGVAVSQRGQSPLLFALRLFSDGLGLSPSLLGQRLNSWGPGGLKPSQ